LDLPAKIKIYLVQHVAMLEPVHRNHKPPLYEADTYRGREEDKWEVQKVVDHQEINDVTWYEIKWTGFDDTTWEPKENLETLWTAPSHEPSQDGVTKRRRSDGLHEHITRLLKPAVPAPWYAAVH
jgi:hypothetical protein